MLLSLPSLRILLFLLLNVSWSSAREVLPKWAYENRTLYPPLPVYKQRPLLSVGIFTDIHYADKEEKSRRHFRLSPRKVEHLINEMNANRTHLDLVFHMGDTVEENIEKNLEVMDTLFKRLSYPFYQMLGNHDFVGVPESHVDDVHRKLGMPSRYYSLRAGKDQKFLLIVLDSTDLSRYATRARTPRREETDAMSRSFRHGRNPRVSNGGIGNKQMKWLREQLEFATSEKLITIVFCHMPLYPYGGIVNLWNDREVVGLLTKFPCVIAVVSGHTHRWVYDALKVESGDSSFILHFVTFSGVVQSPFTSWGFVEVNQSMLHVHGLTYGRAFNFHFPIRAIGDYPDTPARSDTPCGEKCERRAVVVASRGTSGDALLETPPAKRRTTSIIGGEEKAIAPAIDLEWSVVLLLIPCLFVVLFYLRLVRPMRRRRHEVCGRSV